VLTISILPSSRPVQAVEVDDLETSFQFLEGSNLSVRPPPPTFS